MSTANRKGPIVDPGLCRCCGAIKKCRILNVEYEWLGQKEVYSEIFVDCFGLLLSHLDGEPEERLICATCVSRLREASSFRRQVLQCEEKLLKTRIHVHGEGGVINEVKPEIDIKVEIEETLKIDVLQDDIYDNVDLNDNVSEDTSSIKSEPLKKPAKKTLRQKKKAVNVKLGTKRKAKSEAVTNGTLRKKTLHKRSRLKEKPKELTEFVEAPQIRAAMPPSVQKPRVLENDQKMFRNTVTVVENSYVCPFNTSFSDYYCLYCREVFTDPAKLREHTLDHDPMTFKSLFDNKKFAQIDIYRIDCRLCPVRINDIELLKNHLSNTHGKVFYPVSNEFLKFRLTISNLTCIECNSTFRFFHALKKHMAEHFGTCICDVCGAHYFEERMLLLHQKTHQKKIEETFPCKDCGKIFKSRHSRYLHEAKMHKKEPAYQCIKCDEVLFSYALRYRHMIEVHGEQRMFPCEHCDRAYDSRKSLREHNRRFHLKILKHQCDLCDKRFYLPSRLKEHMATHTGERNYRCEYCGKSYPRLRGLKVHMQSHSTEKKYRCVMCNASFTQNVNLKNHMKRQHQSLELESFHDSI